jgi:hypothetical protein
MMERRLSLLRLEQCILESRMHRRSLEHGLYSADIFQYFEVSEVEKPEGRDDDRSEEAEMGEVESSDDDE